MAISTFKRQEIKFILDQSIEYGVHMTNLINEVTKDLTDQAEEEETLEDEE